MVDLHADTLLDLAAGRRDLAGGGLGHVDLPRLHQGGVTVQVFAAFVHPREALHGPARLAELLTAFQAALRRHAPAVAHVRTMADLEAAVGAGRVAAVVSVENLGDALAGREEAVADLVRAGVRMAGLTWNFPNPLADGALEQRHGGLTALGRRVVRRLEREGIVVDVSHLSEAAFWQVLEVTTGPVVASHSNAAAVHPHRRNLTDAQLRAIAARDGVVGVNFYPPFLGAPTLERVVAHIDHMAEVMGVRHVALGSDFDGITQVPAGLEEVSRLPNLTRALVDRGYAGEAVARILGQNALRVFRRVWGR
ncbi:MAG: dipeptidase [Armatimonadota bacterium]|nr:dipeptidase [Armatimonadota bacterium]MDR7447830.1 dipeptidase [Armatimonadota bacterium]MDR7459847.1 dipeptidase [Armatimonadota bacterium]MDR7479821.1 dipeptidase [Armatimonadota bacterium]MDR7487516.1 dipeptidase [Armatimonadota bacterium]